MAGVLRVALRGILGRKLRTALTAVAIILGVAMVTGTFILTDSIDQAFNGIFTQVYSGTDATVTGKAAFDVSNSQNGTTPPPFRQSLLAQVRALPDVQAAVGGVGGDAQLIGKNGKAIVFGGAPDLGFSVDPTQPAMNSLTLVRGSWPQAGQVVVDTSTASKKNFKVGQSVGVQARGPVEKFTISGLVHFGGASSLGGATLAGFDLPTAQHLFQKPGKLDQIRARAKPGISPQRLAAEIQTILPSGTQVRTAAAQAKKDSEGASSFISFLRIFLLVFGGIALFVGAFVIANSLSITIAQRMRELATLRTIGASRNQVLGAVIVEALVMGVLASIVGVLAGLALANGLFSLFDAVGFTLPNNGLVLEVRTVLIALLVGIIVTLLASLRPAFRATRVPPIAAVREGATLPPGRFQRYRPVVALVVTGLGFAALVFGLFGASGTAGVLLFMGVGALLIFVGVALLSAKLVEPIVAVLGWPAKRLGGVAGNLARENSTRNPERTASTAAALMIGLALVTLVAVLAAGITTSFRSAVNDLWNADYAITAQNNFSPIAISAADAVKQVPGVTAVANVRVGDAKIFGSVGTATAVNPDAAQVFNVTWKEGSNDVFRILGRNGAFIADDEAKKHHLTIGSPVIVETPRGARLHLVVKGVFKQPTGGSPFGTVTMSQRTFDRNYDTPLNLYSFLRIRGGETAANQARLEHALKAYPNAKVQTKTEFVDNQISGLTSILNILYVLLALSIVVSLFGIVNTLVLTVFERTREIGMLRAVGMTRRQVRRMIRWESVITALLGAIIGIVLGLVLGALLTARVSFITFTVPTGSLVVFTIAAIIVGLLAAIFPARRAAKLDPLRALQYE
jgi:putative ABC transport system permease protein